MYFLQYVFLVCLVSALSHVIPQASAREVDIYFGEDNQASCCRDDQEDDIQNLDYRQDDELRYNDQDEEYFRSKQPIKEQEVFMRTIETSDRNDRRPYRQEKRNEYPYRQEKRDEYEYDREEEYGYDQEEEDISSSKLSPRREKEVFVRTVEMSSRGKSRSPCDSARKDDFYNRQYRDEQRGREYQEVPRERKCEEQREKYLEPRRESQCRKQSPSYKEAREYFEARENDYADAPRVKAVVVERIERQSSPRCSASSSASRGSSCDANKSKSSEEKGEAKKGQASKSKKDTGKRYKDESKKNGKAQGKQRKK